MTLNLVLKMDIATDRPGMEAIGYRNRQTWYRGGWILQQTCIEVVTTDLKRLKLVISPVLKLFNWQWGLGDIRLPP